MNDETAGTVITVLLTAITSLGLGSLLFTEVGKARQARDMRAAHCANLEGEVHADVCVVKGSVITWPWGLGVDDE